MYMLAHQLPVKGKNGVERKSVEIAFYQLSDQIRRIDQKLTMKIENNISSQYYDRLNEMEVIKNRCKHLRKKKYLGR
ncbi:hypothetical protein J32TS6_03700 [Virgibacillus pantothenticus]|uniref:Uncharacterized protein n=1 Tax=Virgibacillus pantothenticus TaxID=1473 RepID=A0A0L0QNY2_VIRPA|nr:MULTISPECIES: hypothetical protein [Virgibacillus]KNE20340.1 hypothetical protein AFK71_18360 [Virgibacillus pantothenticus]MBS7429478.1 hypothetical protein [Virgibacillus sp. 19R1-5]MBU8567850.1 hypothetical protein [Virgibacillus pantothenticus]MBU8601643.1 hypothetical protein [Virgibacillus pantothenticus]MBU8635890.1 hypothetical protein [Virgibacillus pantothenticus]